MFVYHCVVVYQHFGVLQYKRKVGDERAALEILVNKLHFVSEQRVYAVVLEPVHGQSALVKRVLTHVHLVHRAVQHEKLGVEVLLQLVHLLLHALLPEDLVRLVRLLRRVVVDDRPERLLRDLVRLLRPRCLQHLVRHHLALLLALRILQLVLLQLEHRRRVDLHSIRIVQQLQRYRRQQVARDVVGEHERGPVLAVPARVRGPCKLCDGLHGGLNAVAVPAQQFSGAGAYAALRISGFSSYFYNITVNI